jgi:signal transduction histidine kinase/CheY-like chemotaxis protein
MHSLLARQLRKSGYQGHDLDGVLGMVDAAYRQYDDDRLMLERSLELSSLELLGANSDLRALLGSLPDLFVRIDEHGIITDVQGPPPSEYFPKHVGILGQDFTTLVEPSCRVAIADVLRGVRTAGTPGTFEYQLTDAHGITRHYEARFLRVMEQQLIGLVRNITAIKEEAAAKEARTARIIRQQSALHELAAAEGTDPSGAFGRACTVAARTLRAARASIWYFDEPRGSIACTWLYANDVLHPSPGPVLERSAHPRYFAALEEHPTLAATDALQDARTSELAPGYLVPLGIGAVLDCAIRVGGTTVGMFCIAHVGGPREWSLEEQDFAAAVASFVALSYTLDQQRDLEAQLRHSQKMEAVGMLAGGVAHDFNNLLTAILGFAELLRFNPRMDALGQSHVREIALAGKRASELTSQLLAFGRKQPRAPQLVGLNALVADSSRLLSRVVGEAIAFVVRESPVELTVRVDPHQIEQVLMNLVVNARDAMAQSGGSLEIRLSQHHVGPDARGVPAGVAPGEWAVLEVQDSGVGIAPEHLARVFEPFFTTKGVGEGTGLGLAMVYGLVQQNGGHIELASSPGFGTTVRVFLPLDAEAASVRPDHPGAGVDAALDGGVETVLLVEDEAIVRLLAFELLQRLGYEVLVASRPSEALAILEGEQGRVELMVTDLVMPEMNGVELSRAAEAIRPGLRVVYMSGYAPDKVLRDTGLGPGRVFLPKPFTLRQLSEKVREALQTPRGVESLASPEAPSR